MTEHRPAVFLDRDGTINEEMGYINHIDRFVLLPGVGEAIARLNQAGYKVVVTSNQSGVAQGYFPEQLVNQVNQKMRDLLAESGAHLDGVYYCPHHPAAEVEMYRRQCDCRKPGRGLFLRAQADLGLDLRNSYVIGDRNSDLKAARQIGAHAVLVLTGYGLGELEYVIPHKIIKPDHVADDLSQAVDWILEADNGAAKASDE